MRRRDEWSKWVSASADQKSSPLSPVEHLVGKVVLDIKNEEVKENKEDGTQVTSSQENRSVGDELPLLEKHAKKVSVFGKAENSRKKSGFHGSTHRVDKGSDSRMVMASDAVDDLSNDFSSTFMLDEEMELEHKKDQLSLSGRYR